MADKLAPASPEDLAAALAFALRYEGRRRVHNADEVMSEIVATRLVRHLERAGFVVMWCPSAPGAAALVDKIWHLELGGKSLPVGGWTEVDPLRTLSRRDYLRCAKSTNDAWGDRVVCPISTSVL